MGDAQIHNQPMVARILIILAAAVVILQACDNGLESTPEPTTMIEREAKIPSGAVKMAPETDLSPPVTLASDYEAPIPLPGAVNTAGAEDSPFITPDGNTLFFFFTPDVNVPVEKQLLDGVTGIYVSHKVGEVWGKPERVLLQEPGKLALDGCTFVLGDRMWFCTTREGYEGIHWFTAESVNGKWQNWQEADFDSIGQVGELHVSRDRKELYFHSDRSGSQGGLDIWLSLSLSGTWQMPVNVAAVNTGASEGWPALNPEEDELWFYRDFAIWRSQKVNGEWQTPEKMVSPLAGEPSLDNNGNLYFVHHFFVDGEMIEADIYVAYRK